MSERYTGLVGTCDHESCTEFGGRVDYCPEDGEDPESYIPIVLDQIEDIMFMDADTVTSDISYSTDGEQTYMERSFNYLQGDFKGYRWPLGERSMEITRQTASKPNKIAYTVSLGWKVNRENSVNYAPYVTSYFIEVGDEGVEASVYENDIIPEYIIDQEIGSMTHVRAMTPYDNTVLFESLSEVTTLQKAQALELDKG